MSKLFYCSSSAVRLWCLSLCVVFVGVGVSGCDLAQNLDDTDRPAEMSVQDYRDGLAPRPRPDELRTAESSRDAGIPDFQTYVNSPSENGLQRKPFAPRFNASIAVALSASAEITNIKISGLILTSSVIDSTPSSSA